MARNRDTHPILVILRGDEVRALQALKRRWKRNTSDVVRELILGTAVRRRLIKAPERFPLVG